jgi:ubiquinone biosynthesis protein COQ9
MSDEAASKKPRKKKPEAPEASAPKPEPGYSLKDNILAAALKHAAFDGFTDKVLEQAGKEVGADRETIAELFPDGPLSLIEAFSKSVDEEMEKRLKAKDITAMKIRDRIREAVLTRFEILRPNKEAARRAAAMLTLPPHVPLATKLLYRTVDSMWRAAGDTSTDFNFYTKRGILAGVYSSTLLRWFTDQGEGETQTREFLAARIENVMQFEKFKARVREQTKDLPSLADILGKFGARKG